jgi:SAM-dependent methyltransferase
MNDPHDSKRAPAPDYSGRELNPARLAAIRDHAKGTVLDVGCGNGAYVLALADRMDIRGVDHQPFDRWKERPDRFSVGDAQTLQLPDASVDTILSFETLEHLPDPGKALGEYFRVCRQNLVITVPNCDLTAGMRASGLIFNHWIDRTHVNFWNMATLCSLIESSGFRATIRQHINAVRPGHMLMESLGLSGLPARAGAKLLAMMQRRQYWMTCLIVAQKPSAR